MLSSVSKSACGQGLGELGLADAGRAQEDERADRPARILDARARAHHGVGHRLHGLVLADDALVQDLVEAQQLLRSPSTRRVTGMPVQRETISAISSSVTSSRSSRTGAGPAAPVPAPPVEALSAPRASSPVRQQPVAELGGLVQVVGALRGLDVLAHLLDLLARLSDFADRFSLRSHCALSSRSRSLRSASSLRRSSSRSLAACPSPS